MHRYLWLSLFLISFSLIACDAPIERKNFTETPPLEVEEVERIYGLYLRGFYREYIDEMESCDNQPDYYRQQMVDLHKMHAYQQKEKYGGVKTVQIVRIEPTQNGSQANVFLRIDYNNQTHETLLLSMIYDGERWRLR